MATTTTGNCVLLPQWIALVFLFTFIASEVRAQDYAPDKAPPTKWYIDTPEFTADRLDLYLKYPISDIIPFDNLVWTLMTDCSSGTDITENDFLAVQLTIEDEKVPEGDGNQWRFITLSFTFDPTTIRSSPIITTVNSEDRLQFCVHLGGYSAPTVVPGAMEIVAKETTVDIVIQQDGQASSENAVVTPVDPEEGSQLYKLRGFLCNETNHEITNPIPIYQGTLTKVCVTPTDDALASGVYMHAIDSFYWTRETIYQSAINPHQAAQPLTQVSCEPGMKVCSFVTMLKADFFYRLGRVVGAGVGWLQFGRGDYKGDQRRMRSIVTFENENLSNNIEARQSDGTTEVEFENYAGAGPFVIDLPVTRLYRAYGWLCDKDNQELNTKEHPIVMGQVARVCVTPDDIAIHQDNVRIRSIDSFTWMRDDVNATQTAIIPNAKTEPRTEIFCKPGSIVCAFETNLKDEFYGSPGSVNGNGVVWLQFGEDSSRSLGVSLELNGNHMHGQQRYLQYGLQDFEFGASYLPLSDPGFAGASPFNVVIYTLPPVEERELYGCRAYECDYSNNELVSNEPKREGDSIRICVRPSETAEAIGVKMWSIEWWQWSQVDRVQDAVVKQGKEAADGKTVLFCYRGMDICFFQTALIADFFSIPQPNILNGNGVCWLTFGEGFAFPAPMYFEDNSREGSATVDPTANPLYAGHNDISINFPTEGNATITREECPPEDHTLNQWFEELDSTTRAAIVSAMVLAGTGLCFLWGLCFFCNRSDKESDELILEKQNLVVNVDVQGKSSVKKTVDHNENQHAQAMENDQTIETSRLCGSSSLLKPKFDGTCRKHDILFDNKNHPGTMKLRSKVRDFIEKYPHDDYGPDSYVRLRRKFEDSFFLVRDGDKRKWREATKTETVAKIGEIWMVEKSLAKEKDGEYTKKNLQNMERREKKGTSQGKN